MVKLSYDFHIHSCLSPCGDNDMTPSNIVGMAYLNGLDVIAITDHNSCRNCGVALETAKEYGITVLCGMELTTEEEVHVVCLFPELKNALDFNEYVYDKLQKIENEEAVFGEQRLVDCDDNILEKEKYLLINATNISFEEAFILAENFGGVAFPAHIDKSANSLFSNLGFIPPNCNFNTVEIKNDNKFLSLCENNPYLKTCLTLKNSDAHYLTDISQAENYLMCNSKSPIDIINAIKNNK